jgi:hypothetical protein
VRAGGERSVKAGHDDASRQDEPPAENAMTQTLRLVNWDDIRAIGIARRGYDIGPQRDPEPLKPSALTRLLNVRPVTREWPEELRKTDETG